MSLSDVANLLIVDDNAVDRERIRRLLGAGHAMSEASTAAQALEALERSHTDCVLLDYRLPDRDGIDLIDQLVGQGLSVVMLTGQGDEHVAVEAMKRGAQDYLVKRGLDGVTLRRAVEHALENQRLRRRIDAQHAELEARIEELARQRSELEVAHRALAERETELQLLLRQLPAIVWTTDTALRYTSRGGNAKLASATRHQIVGNVVGTSLADEDRAAFVEAHRAALAGRAAHCEFAAHSYVFQCWIEALRDVRGELQGTIGVALDVTTMRELEQQLRRSQKMEALGALAGGVAHDFNNILTAIFSFAGFARESVPPGEQAADDLIQVLEAAQRGASLVRQLLAFSRHRAVELKIVDVNDVLRNLLPMLRRLLGEDVDLVLETGVVWNTQIDPGGLEQIVINMVVNARDAMPRGGRLCISTQNMKIEAELPTGRREELAPGSYVVLAISDDGEGIAPEVQERIFEPFFTTKELGRGTGLGLATCWGIARQAGGSISLYSEVGGGTTFKVYLPRHAGASSRPGDRVQSFAPAVGSELVLVVEDDAQVQALTVRTLTQRGYEVLHASTPAEARAWVEARGDDIQLVLTDVVMPGLSGPELVASLRTRLPNATVLYMSGYTGAAVQRRGLLEVGAPILEKPFTPDLLARKVREVLDGRRP